MELERYEALIQVIDTGSLSSAAKKLGYTPSGISRMMAALEEEVGFPLLIRQRNGVVPTHDCKQILPSIRELLYYGEACRQISAQIKGLDVGTVTIGTAYSAYYVSLANAASSFHRQYPGIKIELLYGYSTELLQMMEQHTVDLCLISWRESVCHWIPLAENEMLALIPPNHPLASQDFVPIEAFATEPYIETYPGKDVDNTRIFKRCRIHPNTNFTTTDSYATFSLVEAGLGISMNNEINCRLWNGSVKFLPLSPPQMIPLGIAYGNHCTLAAQTFLHFLQSQLVVL